MLLALVEIKLVLMARSPVIAKILSASNYTVSVSPVESTVKIAIAIAAKITKNSRT